MMNKIRMVPFASYIEAALRLAEYERDEDGVVIAEVSHAQGFYAQGNTFEEARENLRDVIEGHLVLALQLGWPIPAIEGVIIEEQDAEAVAA
jgi:predicted RNase H-like HicB family nuclease